MQYLFQVLCVLRGFAWSQILLTQRRKGRKEDRVDLCRRKTP